MLDSKDEGMAIKRRLVIPEGWGHTTRIGDLMDQSLGGHIGGPWIGGPHPTDWGPDGPWATSGSHGSGGHTPRI